MTGDAERMHELSREEIERVALAYDEMVTRVNEAVGQLTVTDGTVRLGDVQRATALLLINPWPVDEALLAGLRALDTVQREPSSWRRRIGERMAFVERTAERLRRHDQR